MKPTIEIIVSPMGDFSVEGIGFKGADCDQATRFIEEAMGVISSKAKKPEYHQRVVTKHQQQQGS